MALAAGDMKRAELSIVRPPDATSTLSASFHHLSLLSTINILTVYLVCFTLYRYFQHAYFIPIVGVGKERRTLVHGDLQNGSTVTGTTLRTTGPAPADSRHRYAVA